MKIEYKEPSTGPRPLEGIKIVEYGVFHAGPGGCAILGDLGAEVIKIEAPSGDPERNWKSFGNIDMSAPNGESLIYEISNRNKKNICLDIKTDAGQEILHRLVKNADVFMTNLRKTTKTNLGIDYQALSKVNPKIIHANVSGYGPEGPLQDIGAFDPLGQAWTGMMFVTGSELPAPLQLGILDQATAITLSHAIITALLVKERQGISQELHVSLYATSLWLQYINLILSTQLGVNPCSTSDRLQHSPLRNIFCCKDGEWIMGTHHPEERYWAKFCEILGKTDLLENPKYTGKNGQPINFPELNAIFDPIFATRPQEEWMTEFLANKLMFASIKRIADVVNDPQALLNKYIIPCNYPGLGEINIPAYPVHFSESSAGTQTRAPNKGEQTDEILDDLGYKADEIEKLKKGKVIH